MGFNKSKNEWLGDRKLVIDDIYFIISFCPNCGFMLGEFLPGIECPECGETII